MLLGKASPEDMSFAPASIQVGIRSLQHCSTKHLVSKHEIALKEDLDDFSKMTDDERHAVKF